MTNTFSPQRSRLEGTASAADAITRVHYTHDAIIDMIVECPDIPQSMLAANFGFTEPWVSRVINSDAFQVALAQRKSELIDPNLVASIEERLREVATKSLAVVMTKLNAAPTLDQALKAVEVSTKCLGYGARDAGKAAVQNNFVVHMPSRSESAESWSKEFTPQAAPATIDG